MTHRSMTVLCALLCAVACVHAHANGAPGYPGPVEAIVEGPDVRLRQQMPERSHCTLVRIDTTDEAEVEVGVHGWDGDEPVGADPTDTWQACHAPPEYETECQANPDDCVDCDGDGVPECVDWCVEWGSFELVDVCATVPREVDSREYAYTVGDCVLGGQSEPVSVGPTYVMVERVDPCQLTSGGEGGCACASTSGPGSVPWIFALGMILFGFVALAIARRWPTE